MPRRLASTIVVGLVLTTFTACDLFGADLTKAGMIVQSAIDALTNAPGNVEAVLSDTISQLNGYTDSTIQSADAAAKDVLASTAGIINATVQCQIDSLGLHARDALIYIKAKILEKTSPPPPTPWACITNPTTISITQHASAGPYTVDAPFEYAIYGFNFRDQTTPVVSYYRTSGQVFVNNVVAAGLHTAYEIDLNLQTVDFSQAHTGDYLKIAWSNGDTGSTRIDILLHSYHAPPPPPTRVQDFVLSVHANPGLFSGECKNLQDDQLSKFNITSPWKVDPAKGDPGHPGVQEIANDSNNQANNSLRGYNYQAINAQSVQIVGTVCGAGGDGPGAIFYREYAVYETQ